MKAHEVIEKVVLGESADDVLEQFTNGYLNAIKKQPNEKATMACPNCGHKLINYPGRYPEKCPLCDTPLEKNGE